MAESNPTVRSIARETGYSVATVSEALRGTGRVRKETSDKILLEAQRQGYARNALIGDVMSRMRRSQTLDYNGNIAILETESYRQRRRATPWHVCAIQGATERAEEFGFRIEYFLLDSYRRSLARLHNVLYHRGIQGILLPPYVNRWDLTGFDWSDFSVVQMDFTVQSNRMHSICPDHHITLHAILKKLMALGYQRPGLAVEFPQDERVLMRWLGAYQSFAAKHAEMDSMPVLNPVKITKESYLDWFEKYRPEIILGHKPEFLDWLHEEGVAVPQEVAFASLNLHHTQCRCAGINLRPQVIGAIATEVLVGQIHLMQRGVPTIPRTISAEGEWCNGPTVMNRKTGETFPYEGPEFELGESQPMRLGSRR